MPVSNVLIAGPTASGKTGLAIKIADRIGGIIINADALQVYTKWRVLTARPTDAELARAPHHLYGHVDEDREYSVGEWLKEVSEVLAATGKPAVIIGGTGLYFNALLKGLSKIPPIPPDIRAAGDAHRLREGAHWFQRSLLANDPGSFATLDQNNPARLQRAWEVLEATGHGLSYWHARPTRPLIKHEDTYPILLNWRPDDLNTRINTRFNVMMDSGAVDECVAAKAAGFNDKLPANRAIGAKEIIEAISGNITMQDAVIKAKTQTHQFAKRQRTWFRSKMQNWLQIDMSDAPNLDAFVKTIPR